MRRSIVISAAVLAGLGLSSAAVVRADVADEFHLLDQSCVVDQAAGTATFRLSFDREPHFFLPPGGADQPNGFQIEIDADNNTFDRPIEFADIDSIVRGAEIFAGDGIPVRDREGDGGSDHAGGWGPVRGLVPFELEGTTLTFTTGLGTIGDQDGRFRYRVITTDQGGLTSEVNAAIIPLPAAVWGGIMMLSGAGVFHRLRKRSFC
ncbi:MAG: hypothetical protein QOE14_2944 [Humisphaera sp.]|nr:hypothetical protein [Humisphaera sp.]